jgi:hypothetical protein
MTFLESRSGLIFAAALGVAACSSGSPGNAGGSGSPGGAGSTTSSANTGSPTSGAGGDTTTGDPSGNPGQAPAGASGTAATTGAGGAGTGTVIASGSSGTIATGAVTGAASGGAATGASGGGDSDAGPPRPIQTTPGPAFTGMYNGQPMSVNLTKPIVGKLVLLLGGICTGTGAGGFESFIELYGFHVFAPKTQTCVNSAPQMYKTIIETMPNDPEANRQVGDARMELWDGVDRVNWVTVAPGTAIVDETVGAIQYGMMVNPGGDWGYFLNADGTLRTTDVWVVGYSWGSQSWAMISSYVQFDRVITTSGPQDEGFPNATWITNPTPATPGASKYILVGFDSPYPSTNPNDSEVMSMFTTVTKAGWVGVPTNVLPNGMGTYTAGQHLFAMIGSNGASPGGHTVFCNDNQMNGWIPLCKYVVNVN